MYLLTVEMKKLPQSPVYFFPQKIMHPLQGCPLSGLKLASMELLGRRDRRCRPHPVRRPGLLLPHPLLLEFLVRRLAAWHCRVSSPLIHLQGSRKQDKEEVNVDPTWGELLHRLRHIAPYLWPSKSRALQMLAVCVDKVYSFVYHSHAHDSWFAF